MAALAMGLALAVALPVAACGDDTGGGSSGSGGAGGSGPASTSTASGDGGATNASVGSSSSGDTTSSAVSTYGVATSVGSSSSGGDGGGGSACLDEPFFEDPSCDGCAQDSCCPQMEACVADPANCSDAEGFIDPESSLGGPLLGCLETQCAEDCGGGLGICDSGLTTSDPTTDACLGESCCVEFNTCTSTGADVEACIACFDAGGGPLCDGAIACGEENRAG